MRIAVLKNVREFIIEEQSTPLIGPNEVLIRVKACGICTSDLYVWSGKTKNMIFPRYLGHEPSGIVESVGEFIKDIEVGEHVTLWTETGGYAEYLKVPRDYIVKIPKDLPFEAALGEPLACAINGVRRASINLGDSVVLIGCGFMGCLLLQGIMLRGPSIVVAVDIDEDRLNIAEKMGADVTLNAKQSDVQKVVMDLTDNKGADIVIEATGHQDALTLAGKLVRIRGKLVIFGYHASGPREIDMAMWNYKGLDVINAHEREPNVYVEGMKIGMRLLSKGKITMRPLITHIYPLEKINEAFSMAETKPKGFIKAVISP